MNKQERKLDNGFRRNYITCYGKLIADNIAEIYKVLGNNHNRRLCEIYREAKDSYILDEQETLYLERFIDKHLKEVHKLELVSKNLKSKIEVRKLD